MNHYVSKQWIHYFCLALIASDFNRRGLINILLYMIVFLQITHQLPLHFKYSEWCVFLAYVLKYTIVVYFEVELFCPSLEED